MPADVTSTTTAAHHPGRRQLLARVAMTATTALAGVSQAAPRVAPRADSPEVGVDPALVASGLTARWGQAMHRDLGWSARWTPLPSGTLLRALSQGDIDMGVYLGHPLADRLAQEGLIHDRHPLARTDVLLLGPTQDDAGIRSDPNPAAALRQVLAAHAAGAVLWQPPEPDTALAAWLAGLGLATPPKVMPGRSPSHAPSAVPYRLSTRAEWLAEQARRERLTALTRIWLPADRGGAKAEAHAAHLGQMRLRCELARSFRTRHPGASMLSRWLQGPLGQQAVKALPAAWQPPSG